MPYRPTPRTEARKADLRRRILSAARDLVSEGGFANAPVASVARRAGVATGTVYRYFPSKSDLFVEVFRQACQREQDVLRGVLTGEGTPTERLVEGLETFARRAIRGRRLAYALIAEPIDVKVDEERIRFRRMSAEMFAELLEEGMATGEFGPQNVQLSAAAVVGAISEVLLVPTLPEGPAGNGHKKSGAGGAAGEAPAEGLIEQLVQFCLRSVSAKGGILC